MAARRSSVGTPVGSGSVKLVLLGDSGVGKTSIVTRFVFGKFVENQQSTIGGITFPHATFHDWRLLQLPTKKRLWKMQTVTLCSLSFGILLDKKCTKVLPHYIIAVRVWQLLFIRSRAQYVFGWYSKQNNISKGIFRWRKRLVENHAASRTKCHVLFGRE